jgi:hypothetical protein
MREELLAQDSWSLDAHLDNCAVCTDFEMKVRETGICCLGGPRRCVVPREGQSSTILIATAA